MRKWLILIIVLLLVFVGYNYVYQDHRNIGHEEPEFSITSVSLIGEFQDNALESEKKYLNKTIEVFGLITEINSNDLTLDKTVFCQFENIINQSFKVDSKLKVKGRIIGYDDLLEQIKLDQCIIK